MDDHADNARGDYNHGNRAFLQAFMGRGQLSLAQGQKILAAIFSVQEGRNITPDEVTQDDFDTYVSAAANALSPLDYEIRSTQHQVTKERIYAVVNSISDPLTQMATIRSTEEMLYVKRMLDCMFETYNTQRREVMAILESQASETKVRKGRGRVSGDGSQIATVDKGLMPSEVESLLRKLVKEKWLDKSKEGFHTLSPRALLDLRSWLIETYNDETDDPDEWQRIKFCQACKDIVTIGQRCANLECNIRLHNICGTAYWNSRPNKQCPKCHTEWDEKHYVGQKVATAVDQQLRKKRRSNGASASRKRPAANDEDDDGEEEQPRVSRRSRREVTEEAEDDEPDDE